MKKPPRFRWPKDLVFRKGMTNGEVMGVFSDRPVYRRGWDAALRAMGRGRGK